MGVHVTPVLSNQQLRKQKHEELNLITITSTSKDSIVLPISLSLATLTTLDASDTMGYPASDGDESNSPGDVVQCPSSLDEGMAGV